MRIIQTLWVVTALCQAYLPVHAEPVNWGAGPVVVVNETGRSRTYVVHDSDRDVDLTRSFVLPSGGFCRIDTALYFVSLALQRLPLSFHPSHGGNQDESGLGDFVEDVSEGRIGVLNGAYVRRPGALGCSSCEKYDIMELLDCSAEGDEHCAGQRWASWQVGLLVPREELEVYPCGWSVLSSETCKMDFAPDRLYWPLPDWNRGSDKSPSAYALRYNTGMALGEKALLLVQGGMGGMGFDLHRFDAMRSTDMFQAPVCSTF